MHSETRHTKKHYTTSQKSVFRCEAYTIPKGIDNVCFSICAVVCRGDLLCPAVTINYCVRYIYDLIVS